jgi:transcriptional antiterminator/mannitol/fructose-specific phosphotransferase system IIA component (Ntr-type)
MGGTRSKTIFELLAGSPGPITVAEIAAKLGVSPRTVRYELDDLEPLVRRLGGRLTRRPRVGIAIEGLAPESLVAGRLQLRQASRDSASTPEGRRRLILVWLLQEPSGLTLASLCRRLFVSRSTLRRDLAAVKQWLAARNVTLVRRSSRYQVRGTEAGLRQCLVDLLVEATGIDAAGLTEWDGREAGIIGRFLGLGLEVDLETVRDIILTQVQVLPYSIAESSLAGLVYHVAVSLRRVREGNYVDALVPNVTNLEGTLELEVARAICKTLAGLFHVRMPDGEAYYIALHLLGAKVRAVGAGQDGNGRGAFDLGDVDAAVLSPTFVELARQFARHAGAALALPLENDEQLIYGLALHLQPAIHRLKAGLVVRNPLLELIRERYALVFDVAQRASEDLSREVGVAIPEEEVGYLAAHVGAALERYIGPLTRVRALLVCGTGVGTAELLRSIIVGRLPEIDVVGMTGARSAFEEARSVGAELIISTLTLPSGPVPVVVVNGIPGPEDLRRLRRTAYRLRAGHRGRRAASTPAGNEPDPNCFREGDDLYMLKDVLTSETILLGAEAMDWREAVRLAGSLLARAGYVEDPYTDAMIALVEEIGPYVVVAPGIAMPHARPSNGVRRVGVSLVRLTRPVVFPGKETNPVDLILAFAAEGNDRHLAVMAQLAALLSDEERVKVLRSAQDVEEILQLVGSLEPPVLG